MTTNQTARAKAEAAIAAYDAYVFAAIAADGVAPAVALSLAASALAACDRAARNPALAQVTRDYYRAQAKFFAKPSSMQAK